MNILVLIAGVLDPKWPVAPLGDGLPERAADRLILSPFDEAALEIALRIRDAHSATAIRALVAGGAEAVRLARAVAALNIADVATVALAAPWDQAATARELAAVCDDADLVLMGREFGDCDDGLVPPMLAGLLGKPFFGRVQVVEATGAIRLMREAAICEEWLTVAQPIVASVTNDRRTRLRKPLMKNVMMARQTPIGTLTIGTLAQAPKGCADLAGVSAHAGARAMVDCAMIGGSPEDQASAIAALLVEAAR
jgi:electron transfer flavoprotein beta subunit